MKYIGLDAGSVSVKLAVFDGEGRKLDGAYEKHRGHPLEKALELLGAHLPEEPCAIAVTGSAGRMIAEAMGLDPINEIVAQALATRRLYPHVRTVIEMGGEDSKLIVLDSEGVRDFAMNSVCAAGTGSFLDQQGERLRLTPEEMSELALQSAKPPRIAGRCSVFAKSDMIHLQQIATPMHDIVSGLCFAVARNFKGSIVRGRVIEGPVAFQGGVAANLGMRRAFREVFGLDELIVPEDYALMGAIGAALKALEEGCTDQPDLGALRAYIDNQRAATTGHKPLRTEDDDFFRRHLQEERDILYPMDGAERIPAYLGIDIGSISTNLAVIDAEGRLLAKRYLMTAGRPIEAVREGLRGVEAEVGARVEIMGVGTTGSGRYMIADYVGADIVKNEITAQATAAAFIDPDVDTIFEIGGQDSKYVSLRDGVIVGFEMNKACAAGTGSFLEEQAEKLDISVKGEFADCAFDSACPSRLGERCTVFMENSLMANLQKGAQNDDLLAGLAYSIVLNYINRVVAGRPIGKNVFFQGGVAFNKAVVAAFEKHLGVSVTVPPNHDVTGAIGMALIAMRHRMEQGLDATAFKGFGRADVPYEIASFGCKSCSNMCEINTVRIEGEKLKLFYGGRCEKYDVNRKDTSHIEDLFKFRDAELWRHVKEPAGGRPAVGVPYIFFFNDQLPYWSVLLDALGLDMIITPHTNRQIVDKGLQSVISEACFPVKVALGHMRHLRDLGVDAVLSPSFVDLNNGDSRGMAGLSCPHTQTIPYVSRVAIEGLDVIAPVVDKSRGRKYMHSELMEAFARYGVTSRSVSRAMDRADAAQEGFVRALREKGSQALASLTERTVVIVGRAYNSFERGMNLQIPEKLATLGVQAIPMDMLPLDEVDVESDWPSMYWRSGQRILKAAGVIRANPLLFPIFIGNFSCGPDSFILKFFKEALGPEKPFLHIEIDEHSADAGAITRCEAFLDSIGNRRDAEPERPKVLRDANPSLKGRTVYVPPMADHAYAIAAAFERAGIPSEVLPESDAETIEHGQKYVSGKECYPCIVTTGDMVKKATSPGFDPERSAFFMPSGSGPCRFGQYNVFHKGVLEDLGLPGVPVFAPNQDEGLHTDLGAVSSAFFMNAWKGIVAFDLLYKCLRRTKPYERDSGSAQTLYDGYRTRLYDTLRKDSHGGNGNGNGNGNGASPKGVEDVLRGARRDFQALLPPDGTVARKPFVGVVGEIFVRLNRFSNEQLVDELEALGAEVYMAPMEEWVHYVGVTGLRKALKKKSYITALNGMMKQYVQHRVEHKYARIFEGFLEWAPEARVERTLEFAAPYVPDTFEGETVLSVGKSVELALRGASGIVNAMPFGCMPGTIVSALMRAITRDHGVPCISIPYDGTESSTTRLQIEAFMDQARSRHEARMGTRAGAR